MRNVEEVYDKSYCQKVESKEWRSVLVPKIVDILYNYFSPNSVIDFGCANGLHLKSFEAHGVKTFGLEGTLFFKRYIKSNYNGRFIIADMRMPLDLLERFDLAICIEVLEHLEEEHAQTAVRNICRHADNCFVTASSATSKKHLNVRNKRYWVERFEKEKFRFNRRSVWHLKKRFKKLKESLFWMRRDIMVFQKDLLK